MGLVSFQTEASDPAPGYRIDDRIVAIETLPLSHSQRGSPLGLLDEIASLANQYVSEQPDDTFDGSDVRLQEPIEPSTIVRLDGCFEHDLTDSGFNLHVEEAGLHDLDWPSLWVAPNSVLTPPDGAVQLPASVGDVRPGVELGFVVGETARSLDESTALEAIAGCTVCLDLTAHDELPGLEGYKMFDGFLPVGPAVVPTSAGGDLTDRSMDVDVNGTALDTRSTAAWRFDPATLVSHVSEVMTLDPGDLICTGNPIRVERSLSPGDRLTATIEDIGTLEVSIEGDTDG